MEVGLLIVLVLIAIANLAVILLRGQSDIAGPLSALERASERTDRGLRDEIARNRDESAKASSQLRSELLASLNTLVDSLLTRMNDGAALQNSQLDNFADRLSKLSQSNNQQLELMRNTVEQKISALQLDNNQKLEQMRATVDEKLQATLEQRLGASFKMVNDQLELVQRGLGEMQSLATGVGDLKKVLTNIKTRGNWGEVQLGNLLEQMLTPDQYSSNVQVNPMSAERVDFAIRLPGRDVTAQVWLPIDAKFPQEDYQRLVDAADRGDAAAVTDSAVALEARVCGEAKKIRDKYIHSPLTTDFAILFLPTEGLFAEVLRRPGLCEGIQRDHRVILAGPTTLAAVLSSLQMGFRTLVIEQRSSEVWQVLAGIKSEFGKFGAALDKVKKKLHEASNSMDKAAVRSRAVERKLREVQELPPILSGGVLAVVEQSSEKPEAAA